LKVFNLHINYCNHRHSPLVSNAESSRLASARSAEPDAHGILRELSKRYLILRLDLSVFQVSGQARALSLKRGEYWAHDIKSVYTVDRLFHFAYGGTSIRLSRSRGLNFNRCDESFAFKNLHSDAIGRCNHYNHVQTCLTDPLQFIHSRDSMVSS
jgi:hypothetical protein